MARHLWQEWHYTEPRQFYILSRGGRVRWLHSDYGQCAFLLQVPEAIRDFPTPRNITDICSWFGFVNQVSYAFSMAERMLPFRELLKPGNTSTWNESLEGPFQASKGVITKEIDTGVQIFDKTKPTCLTTDWLKVGIGFWMFQKHYACPGTTLFCCSTGWKITLVGSCFTHLAESRYASIEGEVLAVADALDKARFFALGCTELIVAVDHKPLLKFLRIYATAASGTSKSEPSDTGFESFMSLESRTGWRIQSHANLQERRNRQCSTYPMALPALETPKAPDTTSWQAYGPHKTTRTIPGL